MSDVVGTSIGDYRLEALLGAGRSGEVYRAAHVRFDAVRVALRVFAPEVADARGFRTRFFEFAQAAGTLVHPHLVRVRESGEDDRRWFVAMDLMSGTLAERRLASYAEWSPVAWLLVEAVRQAADGVAAAHTAGLHHGNLHPGNLFVVDGGSEGPQIKVGDLGLTALTRPDEAAPSVDGDIVALGRTLYALTTGRDLPVGEAQPAPKRLVSGYPDTLDLIVSRCLAAEARDRFDSCASLAAALREALAAATAARPAAAGAGGPSGLETTVAVVVSRQVPPPRPAATIKPGSQSVPLVHVLDAAGNRVDREFVRHTGLRIGRGEQNDIVLKSPAVSQEHARVDWLDNRVTVTDLGSTNNTQVHGTNLLPQVPQEWGDDQWVRIGPYWLWLELPPPEIDMRRIEIMLDQRSRSMAITPGKPVTCRVTVSNQTQQIQQVELSVEGIPAEWVEGTHTRRHLPLVEQRDMDLVINVPRSSHGLAKTYNVTVRAHSITDPTLNPGTAAATWTVEPFEEAKLALTPTKASGVRSATYNVSLHNNGNRAVTFSLAGSDSDRKLDYSLAAEGYPSASRFSIEVPPGDRVDMRLQVLAPKRWFGSTSPHSFTVQASPIDGKQESKIEGHFLHRAVFPIWALALAPILLIAMLMVVPWLMRPELRTLYLDPINPEPDTSFSVYWDAQRASRIRVFLNELPIRPDPDAKAGVYAFPNGVKRDGQVRVVASNIFGQSALSVPVTLVPGKGVPLPLLEATAEPLAVAAGETVTIAWSASRAERVEFSHRGSVGLTGTFTDHPTQSQTYVVTAFNSEGKSVMQTFKVEVRRGAVLPSALKLSVSSKDFKKDKRNFEINQGRTVFFDWDAPNAANVRIEGGGSAQALVGNAGHARRAQLRGKGHYTFRLVATSETGQEVSSQPIEVDVTCTTIQSATKRCKDTPEVRW